MCPVPTERGSAWEKGFITVDVHLNVIFKRRTGCFATRCRSLSAISHHLREKRLLVMYYTLGGQSTTLQTCVHIDLVNEGQLYIVCTRREVFLPYSEYNVYICNCILCISKLKMKTNPSRSEQITLNCEPAEPVEPSGNEGWI